MLVIIKNNITGIEDLVDIPEDLHPVIDVVPEPTVEEQITTMAEQLLLTQEQLNSAQDALDFLIMGGM